MFLQWRLAIDPVLLGGVCGSWLLRLSPSCKNFPLSISRSPYANSLIFRPTYCSHLIFNNSHWNSPPIRLATSKSLNFQTLHHICTIPSILALNHPKLNEFLISNPHLTIETNSPSDQNHPRILKVQESNQLVRVAWRFNRHCQTLHQNPENLVKLLCVAWGSGGYRQAVPLQEPRNRLKCMCRLVGMNAHQAVSGNFPETQKWNKKRETFIQFRICHAIQTQT